MEFRQGIEQRSLRRVKAHWGSSVQEHLAMVPVFDGGYKVLGLVGLNPNVLPVWYPGVPLVVERRRMVFRSSLSAAPPSWREVDPELLGSCYFFDSWGAIQVLVPHVPDAPQIEGSTNLAGNTVRGRRIMDVVFEPALHRVRALMLRSRWGRGERVPVLRLPALAECLEIGTVPPLDLSAMGPPPERPPGMVGRALRFLLRRLLPVVPDERGASRR